MVSLTPSPSDGSKFVRSDSTSDVTPKCRSLRWLGSRAAQRPNSWSSPLRGFARPVGEVVVDPDGGGLGKLTAAGPTRPLELVQTV